MYQPTSESFEANAKAALANDDLRAALAKAKGKFVGARAKSIDGLPEFDALRDAAREIKDHTLANLDFYLEAYADRAAETGAQIHWARDAASACEIIADICRSVGAKTVTKGKTMVAEEIGLNAYLEEQGLEVVETDLGEYIVQLRREPPSHIIAPAVHVTKAQVADSFRDRHAGLDPDRDLEDPATLLAEARGVLREKYFAADVGITGANFLVAETGTSVIVTNEGNGDLTQLLPRVHIVLASLEKVVPTLEDAATILRVLARSATGQEYSVYTTFSTGKRRPDDPDGPEEYHVVLLDNGRSAMLGGEFQDMLRCIRCGACMNHCPVYQSVGGHAYGSVYVGPMGAVLTPALIGIQAARHLPNVSSFCGRCEAVCPLRIPLPKMMRHWREREFAQRLSPSRTRLAMAVWAFAARRPRLYRWGARMAIGALAALGRRTGALPPAASRSLDCGARLSGARRRHVSGAMGGATEGSVTTAREDIVAAIRSGHRRGALADAQARELRSRLTSHPRNVIPARVSLDTAGLVNLFVEKATNVQATVARVSKANDVPDAVASYLTGENLAARVVMAPDPSLSDFPWQQAPMLEIRRGTPTESDEVSVTSAMAGIAETGTLMMLSGTDHPSTLNFTPDTHIVVLPASRVVGAYEDAWDLLRARLAGGPLPRTVNHITGPSRSADIEQTILLGAHGPRRLHIVLVGDVGA